MPKLKENHSHIPKVKWNMWSLCRAPDCWPPLYKHSINPETTCHAAPLVPSCFIHQRRVMFHVSWEMHLHLWTSLILIAFFFSFSCERWIVQRKTAGFIMSPGCFFWLHSSTCVVLFYMGWALDLHQTWKPTQGLVSPPLFKKNKTKTLIPKS